MRYRMSKQLATFCMIAASSFRVHARLSTFLPASSCVRGSSGIPRRDLAIRNAEKPSHNIVPAGVVKVNELLVGSIKDILTVIYGDRVYSRFYALETIARVPYFAYTSMLHLYETLGRRQRAELMKIHFAESWNELHHLLIMEELGGNERWLDRVVAQHIAFFYYWVVIVLYAVSPSTAYNLNEQVEKHAFNTYDLFVKEHGEELKQLPAPAIAKKYYQAGDLYMFDEFQIIHDSATPQLRRRPRIRSLYDVFVNIRDDEREHFQTMEALQSDQVIMSTNTHAYGREGDQDEKRVVTQVQAVRPELATQQEKKETEDRERELVRH